MAKKKAAAPEAPTKLYKVLTADGKSPYVKDYAWSLPTPREDGSWEPGAWHEEPPSVFEHGRGLHITPSPDNHTPFATCVAYECEATGYRENPSTDHHVVALRVRLLRPVGKEEAARVSREWNSARWVRRKKASEQERMDKIRKVAVQAQANKCAAREAGIASPALTAFRMMVELTPADSWRNVNGSRYDILKYATEYLDFDPEDVRTIHREFDGARWFGENGAETLYALAVESKNNSACVAWETFLGRKPWWCSYGGKKTRAHVGISLWIDTAWHKITSFREDYVNAKRDTDNKTVRLTREQMAPPKEA